MEDETKYKVSHLPLCKALHNGLKWIFKKSKADPLNLYFLLVSSVDILFILWFTAKKTTLNLS
jgi:hypothetical protein